MTTNGLKKYYNCILMFKTMYYLFRLDFLGIPPCCGFMFKKRMQLHHTEMS